ncbi:MAG: tRNA (N(6)-L-threonylcarbamoyladenosine(37)-C(2))-methylthiotransferase MtaB [Parvularculaceae bacterium]
MSAAGPSDTRRPPEVISLGCRLNLAEGEEIRRIAGAAGLEETVVVNSCAVTNEAVRQTRQKIRRAKKENPRARIIVTGCAAQIDADAFAAMPEVDRVIGNAEKLSPAEWAKVGRDAEKIRVNDIMSVRENAAHLIDGYGDRSRAFLQVQNGCDHRCTFCIIPFGRGPSRSVSVGEAVEAVRRLVDHGHPEIVLTGVDMTSWGCDLEGAPKLGRLVGAILDAAPDLFRLRLSSVDCAEIDEELFERLTGEARVAPYLHLSLQAGANLILKRMKRRHSREDAIDLTARLRAKRPEFAIGADLIAGFPTESEGMFEESLALIDEAGVNYAHVFPYSARTGTPAARMPQLSGTVIADRAKRLREKGAAANARFLDGLIGAIDEAVIENGGRARLGNFAPVAFADASMRAGDIARLRITGRAGELLTAEAAR